MAEVADIAIRAASEDSVLIGGMAVSILAEHFKAHADRPVFTEAADFVGGAFAIEQAETNLAGFAVRKFIASMDEAVATPNFGKLAVDIADDAKPVAVDFLSRIDGLSLDEIEQKAVLIELNGKVIRVIHPLLALEHKINNLAQYPAKRDDAGIGQAALMVRVVANYLRVEAGRENPRPALQAIERLGRFAAREAACFAFKAFGIDVLEAIPAAIDVPEFRDVRRPQISALVAERRRRFTEAWDNTARSRDPLKQRFRA